MRDLDSFFRPSEECTPICVGDTYRDYLLSDLVSGCGEELISMEPCFCGFPGRLGGYFLAVLLGFGNTKSVILFPPERFWDHGDPGTNFSPLIRYSDYRVRYFSGGDRYPLWISGISGDHEYPNGGERISWNLYPVEPVAYEYEDSDVDSSRVLRAGRIENLFQTCGLSIELPLWV